MADGADAADASHDGGHFGERAAFDEFFETAELGDVEFGVVDAALVVEVDGDSCVAFDAGDAVNCDGFGHFV